MKTVVAKSISHIFSPLTLWPVLLLLLLQDAQRSGLDYHPILWLILGLELMLPVALLAAFMKAGLISDVDVTQVKQRRLFFILVLIGHVLSTYLIAQYGNSEVTNFRLWLLLIEVVGTAITFAWKISGHLAINSATVIALLIMVGEQGWPWLWLIWLILPIVAWSRVVLHKHTVAQTLAGGFLPIVMLYVVSWLR